MSLQKRQLIKYYQNQARPNRPVPKKTNYLRSNTLGNFHQGLTDVVKELMEKGGEGGSYSIESYEGISALLDLYRCSQTGFPFESHIMREAATFAESRLWRALLLEGHL
ncbi:hypothetical protein AMTRI_Chr11g100290 [Amborella trichopoda]